MMRALALLGLLACARCVQGAPAPSGPAPAPPPAMTCAGPEPTWLRSSWWPSGAVFRCGCGLVSAGNAAAWNDVAFCAAFGDLFYGIATIALGASNGILGWPDAAGNVSTDYCTLPYVFCSPLLTGGTLTKNLPGLLLDAPGLNGTLPASFTALAAMTGFASIGLNNNPGLTIDLSLLAPFAPTLQYLSLSDTRLLGGTLPAALGAFTGLTTLLISNSGLTGTLPPELGALSALTVLGLTDNSLTGSIPEAWAGMTSLVSLSLSNNALSGSLPLALCHMPLSSLMLSTNQISGSIPSLACMDLGYIDLRNNQLTGSIPSDLVDGLACTGQAAYVGLAGNRLTGDLPISLTNRSCVKQLNLQRAVSVCPAGSAETTSIASALNNDNSWTRAACALCPAGYFSSQPGALLCTLCEPGYTSQAGAIVCTPCDAGSFMGKNGTCQACSPGSFSQRGAVGCTTCQSNSYSSTDGTECLPCPDGSTGNPGSPDLASCTCALGSVPVYTADRSSFACTACAAGSFHDIVAGECTACAAGTYNAAAGATQCTPVDTGFVTVLNSTAQIPCPIGTYLNITTAECSQCAPGTYAATTGALACPPCPPSTIAAGVAATACDACPASSSDAEEHTACVCAEGYYDANLGANTSVPQCTKCADGGECVGGQLLASEGWWRESPTDAVFLKCREGYCLPEGAATTDGAAVTRRRLRQDGSGDAGHCADGHGGTLCAICLDGYTMQGGFCAPCSKGDDWEHWSRASKAITIALFVPAGMLLIALLLLLPLLPAVEHLLWGCTATLAVAAEKVASGGAALYRRCCCRGEEEEAPVLRRSSVRVAIPRRSSTGRWSQFAFGRASQVDVPAAEGEPGAEDEKEAEELDTAGAGTIDELLEAATVLLMTLMRPGKILINFYQIVSTFIDTLDVPWPKTFSTIMSRVNIVNVNFLQLPRTACLYPNTPFYKTFMGYTLGTTAGLALVGVSWVAGQRLLAPLTLRSATAAERAHRLRRFQTVCLSRALLLLYLVYPGVSGVVIAIFNCRALPSGRAVLVADHREVCWTAQHWRYVAAGIFWVLAVPIGIPVGFLCLLYYYRVPHMARAKVANAWLGECVEHAWRLGVPQPPVDVQNLGWDNLSDEHLELLVATLVNGEAPAEADADGDKPRFSQARVSMTEATPRVGLLRRMRHAVTCRGVNAGAPHAHVRRAALQKALLHWCTTSATLSLPPLAWAEAEDDAPPEGDEPVARIVHKASSLRRTFSGFSTATLTASSRAELDALEQRALRKVGFLFEAYTVQCWSWEVVELGRKLILTSILALVAPGSATQVTIGVLVAFCMLLLFQRHRPYSQPGMNFVASVAQVNLFFFLFVGLLLKVRLNGDATDSKLFNAIVIILSVVPIALPVALKATSVAGMLDGDELDDAMSEAGENAGADDG